MAATTDPAEYCRQKIALVSTDKEREKWEARLALFTNQQPTTTPKPIEGGNMKNQLQGRQGDVFVLGISKEQYEENIKQVTTQIPDGVLLHGSATGHRHRIKDMDNAICQRETGSQQRIFVNVLKKTALVHDKHGPIPMKRGYYMVSRQSEDNNFVID